MLTVRDIMTRPVVVIQHLASVEQAIWLMRNQRVRSLIVDKPYENGPYGIVTEKDIVYKVIAPGEDPKTMRIVSIMRQPCISVPIQATLQEAGQILADAGIHRAPVIERKQLQGIVSVTDILMKGYSIPPPEDPVSYRVHDALQHAPILDNKEAQIRQETEIAWEVIEDKALETIHQP